MSDGVSVFHQVLCFVTSGDRVGFMTLALWRCVLLWGLFFLDFGFLVWERSRREIRISRLNCPSHVCVVEEGLFSMLESSNF